MPALALALAASAAVVVGAPFVGQLRGALQRALPAHYRAIVAAIVVTAVVAALVVAVTRIRDRRATRYLALASALLIAIAYALAIRTGNVDQDIVEQFHFVEYGLVTYLFYRVWSGCPGRAAVVLPLCAGAIVGLADESFQWFIPTRVGELHDVLIDAVASVCGVLFAVAMHPPASIARPLDRPARRLVAAGVTALTLAGAAFVDAVHLGHAIRQPAVGEFQSRFSAAALHEASRDRAARWRTQPPVVAPAIAREDHYLSEGQWHVQRRNEAAGERDAWSAWHENLILETFFSPVLEAGARWSPQERAAMAATAAADTRSYISDAAPYPMYPVRRPVFWAAVAAIIAAIWVLALRRAPRIAQPAAV
jgi:VanZ family protein